MLLTIVKVVGIALLALTVYYLLCTRFPRLGHSQAFIMIFVSRLLVKLQWACEHAAAFLGALFQRSLRFPPGVDLSECFAGIAIASRLIYLAVSLLIFLGETSNTLSAQSALWGTSTNIQLGGVEIASSALFLCTSALFGAVVLECVGLMPASASFFVPMSKRLRWVVGVIAGLFTLVSLLVVADFYLFRGVYLISPDSAQPLTIWILAGLGLITAAASVLALWGLVVGFCGLFSIVVWLLEKGFATLAMALSLLPSILDVVAVHFSEGKRTTYEGYVPGAPWYVPNTWFGQVPSSRSVPDVPATGDDEVTQPVAQPTLLPDVQKVRDAMKQPEKTASIVLVASAGSRLFPHIKTALADLEASGVLLDSARVDLSIQHLPTAMASSVFDLSPDNIEKQQALVHTGDVAKAYETLLTSVGVKQVEVRLLSRAAPALLQYVLDKQFLSAACPMLCEVKRRLLLFSLVVYVCIVQADLEDESIVQGLKALQALYESKVIEKIILLDSRSAFALAHGEETEYIFAAKAMVSVLLTQKHHLSNLSGNELFKQFRMGGAFGSFSFASEELALGKVPARLSFLPGLKEKTGMGDVGDMLQQTQEAIRRCVQDASCTAFPAGVSSSLPAALIVDVPLKAHDSRFPEIHAATSRFVNSAFPFLTSVIVSGNGSSYSTDRTSRFRVQASLLYSLPSPLAEEPQEDDDSGTRVFTLVPLPTVENEKPVAATGNGNGHTKSRVTVARKSSRTRKNANGK